jgi:hypothetical protein
LGVGIAVGLLTAGAAEATPRYSMAVGQNCNLCHINPTGGGVRDPYATQYLLPTRLAMQLGDEPPEGANPVLGESGIVIGADLRTMWLGSDSETNSDVGEHFREMQGSVYLSIPLPDPRFSIYVSQDFGQINETVEIWGMGYVLPANGYVKAGRLVPAFGWKFSDHRTFSRQDFVFLPQYPPHSDTGVEAGIYPGPFSIEASVLNGAFQQTFDTNDQLAAAARVSWRSTAGPLELVVGGSWFGHPKRVTRESGPRQLVDRHAAGPLASVRWGRAIWLGELDWTRSEPSVGTGEAVWGFATSHELSVRIVQGLDAVTTYDMFDPDWDYATGALHRIGFGVDALTHPFLQLAAKINVFVAEEGDAPLPGRPDPAANSVSGSDYEDHIETQVQIHFLY